MPIVTDSANNLWKYQSGAWINIGNSECFSWDLAVGTDGVIWSFACDDTGNGGTLQKYTIGGTNIKINGKQGYRVSAINENTVAYTALNNFIWLNNLTVPKIWDFLEVGVQRQDVSWSGNGLLYAEGYNYSVYGGTCQYYNFDTKAWTDYSGIAFRVDNGYYDKTTKTGGNPWVINA